LPIVEDDTYGFLQYDGELKPPLRAAESELIFYVGSFAKILAPALRVGWVVVPEDLVLPLSVLKEASDLDTTTLSQCIISSYLEENSFALHLELLRENYRNKRDRMIAALEESGISGATWNTPRSGLFLWLQLSARINPGDLLRHALQHERLAFVPGAAFTQSANSGGTNGARLNFSYPSVQAIDDGISRLRKALLTYLQ
jgi:2-aminoadipate transaminase